ncbi:MAG: phosphoribosyltransferase [Desulfobacteraceae bacterium]|nr:phosphoribosyltransferase [Desulfobacteraceae bacterium]
MQRDIVKEKLEISTLYDKAEFKELRKDRVAPLPDAVEIDLIGERQSWFGEKELLPDSKNNIVGKSSIDKDIMNSDDWLKAKSGDFEAATRVIDSLWSEKKTGQLKELIGSVKDKVLVTMPSSSGTNILPLVMARKFEKEFAGKLKVIQGDEFFNPTHNAEVKNISRFDRVFFKRKYRSEKPLNKNLEGKKAILVDDIFTTGGSVKSFSDELANNKLEVSNVVGLMGDKRFNLDKNTEQKLRTALEDTGIADDTGRLKSILTRTEAGMLIQRLNREKGLKNEKFRELAKRIQRLHKGVFVKNIRGNRKPGRDNSPGRPYRDNAKDAARVQSRGSRGGRGR